MYDLTEYKDLILYWGKKLHFLCCMFLVASIGFVNHEVFEKLVFIYYLFWVISLVWLITFTKLDIVERNIPLEDFIYETTHEK